MFVLHPSNCTDKVGDIKTVEIRGSWDNWRNSYFMNFSNGFYWSTIDMPVGTHEYKYIINNSVWTTDKSDPIKNDKYLNNVIKIVPFE